jgi:hypothetical protein
MDAVAGWRAADDILLVQPVAVAKPAPIADPARGRGARCIDGLDSGSGTAAEQRASPLTDH